jgi:hypothetical protein
MFDAAVTVATATVWRLLLPAAGGQVVFSRLSIHGLRAGPLSSFYDQGGSPGRLPLLLRPQYTSSDSLSNYALTRVSGSQAGLPLLFFSPSAAAFFRGTPDPTLGFPGRPAGRPGTQPGPDPGPVLLGDVPGFCRSMIAWSCGPGRGPARARAPGRAGPGAGSHDGGFDDRPGWRLRGFPSSGCRAPPALFSPAWVILLLRLPCLVCLLPCCSCAGPRSRPGEGALPRRLRAALWEPCGATRLWLLRAPALFFPPSSALARAGPGPSASSPAGAAGRD